MAALGIGAFGGYLVANDDQSEGGWLTADLVSPADQGFARDMRVHHIQAVDNAQIGIMQGWLEAWALPLNDEQPAMAWMGHSVEGLMQGIATQGEVRSISTLPVVEAENLFLQLMISHHQGGVQMATAALELAETPPVQQLAEKIIAAQTNEIAVMTALLAERGASPPDPLPDHDT